MSNVTTTFYHNGYNAALNNQPRQSPHRDGTASETKWLEGYNAFIGGGKPPETPRKKRTKEEMAAVRSTPISTDDYNNTIHELHPALRMEQKLTRAAPIDPNIPREPLLMDKINNVRVDIKTETDSEMLELLEMELADLVWLVSNTEDEKPSTVWELYKSEHDLSFDSVAA